MGEIIGVSLVLPAWILFAFISMQVEEHFKNRRGK